MKAVIQRVNFAKLRIDQQVFSKIKTGLVVLVGITHNDDIDDIKWLVRKILNLRIFNDDKFEVSGPINSKVRLEYLFCTGEMFHPKYDK